MRHLIILFLVCVFFAGCTGPSKLNSVDMESWIGADKSELVKKWGTPNEIYPDSDGGEIYSYIQENEVLVYGLSHDLSTGKANYTATRKFWIDSSGKITYWEWEGL